METMYLNYFTLVDSKIVTTLVGNSRRRLAYRRKHIGHRLPLTLLSI